MTKHKIQLLKQKILQSIKINVILLQIYEQYIQLNSI